METMSTSIRRKLSIILVSPLLIPAFSILAIFLAVFSTAVPAFLLVITLVALLLNTTKRISLLQRFALSLLIFFSFTACVGLITAWIKVPLTPSLLLGSCLVILNLLVLAFKKNLSALRRVPVINMGDVLAIIAMILAFSLVAAPFIGKSTGERLAILSQGEDNASHFALYASALTRQSNIYFLSQKEANVIPNLIVYPQGLHLAMAEGTMIAGGDTSTQQRRVRDYVVGISLLWGLLVYLLTALCYFVARPLADNKVILTTGLILLPFFYYSALGSNLFHLFVYGFHSQIAAYCLLLGLLFLMIDHKKGQAPQLPAMALLVTGISITWYFLLPIACLMAFIFVIKERPRVPYIIQTVGLFLPFAIAPVAITTLGMRVNLVNIDGGVEAIQPEWVGVFCLAFLVLYLSQPGKQGFKHYWPVQGAFLVALVFALIIGGYQMLSMGKTAYYFDKALYGVVLLGVPIVFCLSVIIAQQIGALFEKRVLIAALACGMVFSIGSINTSYYFKEYTAEKLKGRADAIALNETLNRYPRTLPEGHDVIFAGSCDLAYSYNNNRWTGALYLTENYDRSYLQRAIITDGDPPNVQNEYLKRHKDTFVHNHPCN